VTGASGPVRLFVCDDAADFRMLLRYAVEDEDALELVGEAADGETGIAGVAATRPDVALVDLHMPGVDGLEAIPRMRQAAPETRIVVMSGFGREHMEGRALAAGAHGYLQKGADLAAILATLASIAAHGGPPG
jgi:DNA-binding NarL/FixJ family response regulator